MNQEQFDSLSPQERRALIAKQYGGEIPPAIQSEVKRRQTRRAQNLPIDPDYEPADRVRLTLMGPPRTKKNHMVALGVQSPAYQRYHLDALEQLRFAKPLKVMDYQIEAHFYVDGHGKNADLLGLEQALADTLQAAKIVANDKQFRSWDGSRTHHDHGTEPRTEISIRPISEAAA